MGPFTHELTKLKIGDVVYIRGPYGKGIIEFKNKVINLVGGGTGISPVYEIARKYAFDNKIRFFFGGKEREDIFEKEEEENICVSIEYQTSCGVGICGKCATEAGIISCVDGPFLRVSDALNLKECKHR